MTAAPPPTAPRWHAGTLAYTTGGLALLFFWLLWGDFAWSMRERIVPPAIQLLFKRFGASDMIVGLLFSSLPAAIGLVVGPLVGYRSDRLRSRWGRRIPFLALPTPFIVLSLVGMAFAPRIGESLHGLSGLFARNSAGGAAATLVVLALFWTLFELACVTAQSVFYALINDVVPEAVVGRFFGLFRAFSLVAGIAVNFWLMERVEDHFAPIFLGVALLYGAGFTLMCLKVKEGAYPPPPPEGEGRGRAPSAIQAYFRDSFSHPYYLVFYATAILGALALMPLNLYSVFYAKSLGIGMPYYFKCLAATYAISLVLAYPLGALADRLHPLRLTLAVIALYALVMAGGLLAVGGKGSFTAVLIVHGVLAGAFFTASASLPQRLLPRAKFAELNSACGVLSSLATMVLAPVLGVFLDHTHHAYRHVFHAGFLLALAALACGWALHRRFLAFGGPDRYRAPEFN